MYPLARNQYINNSPGIFSCIRAAANTGATCIRPETISLKNLANMQKMTPQKYLPVFARVRIQAPHVFAEKLIPQELFPACIGFVPGRFRICALPGLLRIPVAAEHGKSIKSTHTFRPGNIAACFARQDIQKRVQGWHMPISS